MPDITPQRLSRALNASYNKMRMMRRARVKFLQTMAGRFYSRVAASATAPVKAAPINLLHTAVTTIIPNLVFHNPRIRSRTEIVDYKEYSEVLGLATNHLLRQIQF